MSKSGKSQPNPQPEDPISARLEHVRVQVLGISSKRAFWKRLVEGSDPHFVSYSAVKNYHYDREPPISYLTRVSKVFGVRVPWLLLGTGAPTEAAELVNRSGPALSAAESARAKLFYERIPLYEALDPLVQFQIAGITRVLLDEGPDGDVTDDRMVEAAESVLELLLAPFQRFHGRRPSREALMSDRFTDYSVAALGAISVAARVNLLSLELGSLSLADFR